MKNIIVFETAEELVDAFHSIRSTTDTSPFIPYPIKLISNTLNGVMQLVGDGSERFQLSDDFSFYGVISILAEQADVRLELK